jgi:hypothetical protein
VGNNGQIGAQLNLDARSHVHASRARDALRLMLLPETDDKDGPLKSSIEYFDEMEIYPGEPFLVCLLQWKPD